MSTDFQMNQRPVIFLCKCLGIINISYTSGSDGFLIKNTNRKLYSFLELTRIIVIVIVTYNVEKQLLLHQKLEIYKCWTILIAARISEKWIIKLINGIMEYDQKLTSTLTLNVIHGSPIKKKKWKLIFYCVFAYHVGSSMIKLMVTPFRVIHLKTVFIYLIFFLSYAFDVALVISAYFYLQNLEYRFHTLNGFWTKLPDEFTTTPIVTCGWTHNEITMLVDKIRRLHAELCDLLGIFSTGFGQMLLGFFVFNYIRILFSFFFSIEFEILNFETHISGISIRIIAYLITIKNVIFIMSIIIAASRVNDTKNKMISHLRLIRISRLSANNKLQVKMFMNQLTIFDMDKITAYGIFNINLNLVMSILILLITGLTTLFQMINDPDLQQFMKKAIFFYRNL